MQGEDLHLIYLDHNKREFRGVTREQMSEWEIQYSLIHVSTELRRAARWLSEKGRWENVTKLPQFIEWWFKRQQGGLPVKPKTFKARGSGMHIRDLVHDVAEVLIDEDNQEN